ncbi:hypothetical protein D9Q98_008178 [Chlorella vulgaris]|uniref:Uncharacterized protein n=1 Tax=Chlorella vulgaris TaxID=3077 RepID=A0A9D4YSU6_CHLVU|nr:hypothetical protein D9Q98_008178 [Chlorella vulgaris]
MYGTSTPRLHPSRNTPPLALPALPRIAAISGSAKPAFVWRLASELPGSLRALDAPKGLAVIRGCAQQ